MALRREAVRRRLAPPQPGLTDNPSARREHGAVLECPSWDMNHRRPAPRVAAMSAVLCALLALSAPADAVGLARLDGASWLTLRALPSGAEAAPPPGATGLTGGTLAPAEPDRALEGRAVAGRAAPEPAAAGGEPAKLAQTPPGGEPPAESPDQNGTPPTQTDDEDPTVEVPDEGEKGRERETAPPAPPPAPAAGPAGALPRTGPAVLPIAALGALFLGLGLVLARAARRLGAQARRGISGA